MSKLVSYPLSFNVTLWSVRRRILYSFLVVGHLIVSFVLWQKRLVRFKAARHISKGDEKLLKTFGECRVAFKSTHPSCLPQDWRWGMTRSSANIESCRILRFSPSSEQNRLWVVEKREWKERTEVTRNFYRLAAVTALRIVLWSCQEYLVLIVSVKKKWLNLYL